MDVRIEPHTGINLATGREETLDQDRVFVEGRVIGYLNHAKRPSLILIRTLPHAELMAAVNSCCDKTQCKVRVVGRAPDIPQEFLRSDDDDDE